MYTDRYAERKPGLDKSQSYWPCMTMQGIKASLKNKVTDQFHEAWLPCVNSFFLFSLLLSFLGWSLGVQGSSMFTSLPGLLRPTQEGAQGGAPSAIHAGACGLREWRKSLVLGLYWLSMWTKEYQPLSLLCFLNCKILSLSLYLSYHNVHASDTLDPTGAGPQYLPVHCFSWCTLHIS